MIATILLALAFIQASPAVTPADATASTSGINIYAELKKKISSSTKPGHDVELIVVDDVQGSNGSVLIPKGAKLTGKVTVARKRKKDEPAALSFVVNKAEWKDGSLPLNAGIERVELMGMAVDQANCLPDLNRTGSAPCGNATKNPVPFPPSCSIGKADNAAPENAVICTSREIELLSGARIFLKQSSGAASQ